MAEENNATADTAAAGTAAQVADAGTQDITETAQRTDTKAVATRADDGKFEEVPEWRKVLGKRAKDFTGKTQLARSYVEAEQRLSRSLVMPGKDATDEDKAKFDAGLRRVLGVPDKIEDFKVELPEGWGDGEAALVTELVKQAHADRIPPGHIQKILALYDGWQKQAREAADKAAEAFQADSIAAKKREWGADFQENIEFAKGAIRQFGDGTGLSDLTEMTFKEAAQKFGDVRIGDHPDMLEVFARAGREIGDPTVKLQVSSAGSAESIEARMSGLYDELYKSGTSETRKAEINAELNGLNEKLYGTRPITGRAA